ncbi:MAG: hypothetical protein ACLR52_00685 [Veillonella atypica]
MLTQQRTTGHIKQISVRYLSYARFYRTDNVRYSGELNERLESYLGERIKISLKTP